MKKHGHTGGHKARPVSRVRTTPSQEIAAGEFKTRCLALMDRVRDRGEQYVITKRGKAIARLAPVEDRPADVFGSLRGTVVSYDDLIGSSDDAWEAESDG